MKNTEQIVETLEKIGLSEKEAAVYLAALSLGPAKVAALSRESGVKRSTVYGAVENLKRRGLMRIEAKGFKNVFVPEDPVHLENILDDHKRELMSTIPELSSLYNFEGGEAIIKYYDTPEGVQTVYREVLNEIRNGEDYYVVGDPERYDTANESFFKSYIKKRIKTNLNAKLLLTHSDLAHEYKKFEHNFGEEVRVLPKHVKIDTNLTITEKKVIVHQIVAPHVTIVIENKSMVNMQKILFELLWEKY